MKEKTPLIRLAKREDMKKSRIWLIRLAAFVVAILIVLEKMMQARSESSGSGASSMDD